MVKEAYLIGGLVYCLIGISVLRHYRQVGKNWLKCFALGLFWPITMLVEWLRATSAVLKDDETMKEFFGRIQGNKTAEVKEDGNNNS